MVAALRRRLACRGVLAVLAAACLGREGLAQDVVPQAALLLATPNLRGSMFERSVVVVAQASDGSTIGLILNRPGDGVAPAEFAHPDGGAVELKVYQGGPLAPRAFFALAEGAAVVSGALAISAAIQLAAGTAAAQKMFSAAGAGRRKLFRGYAGWTDGQLAQEINGGFWSVRPVVADLLFDSAPQGLWERLTAPARAVRWAPAAAARPAPA